MSQNSLAQSPHAFGFKLLLFALAISIFGLLRNIDNPLYERHSFRQTQTAVTALAIAEGGGRLDGAMYVFGPPWHVPIEFPIYQNIVAFLIERGCSLELASRLVSFFFFLLCLIAVRRFLAGLGFGRSIIHVTLAVILVFPTYQLWSRTCLIESTALAGALWGLVVSLEIASGKSDWWRWLLLCLISIFAALQKPNTFGILPLCVLGWGCVAGFRKWRLYFCLLLCISSGVVAFAAWSYYANLLKQGNYIAQMLSGAETAKMVMGPVADRFDLRAYALLSVRSLLLFPLGVALAIWGGLKWRRLHQGEQRVLVSVAAVLCVQLLFMSVYKTHDYYHYSVSIFVIVGGVVCLLGNKFIAGNKYLWILLITALAVGNEVAYQRRLVLDGRSSQEPYVAVKEAVDRHMEKDAVLVVIGDDWSSAVNYYTRRKTFALPVWLYDEFKKNPRGVFEKCNLEKIDGIVIMRNEYSKRADWLRVLSEALAVEKVHDLHDSEVAVSRAKWIAKGAQ